MMRAINENNFVNLSQFSSQKSTLKNNTTTTTIKNKIFYCDNKSLSDQHITTKNFQKRSFEFKLELLYFEKNRYLHCKAYQYNNECYKIKRKSKY